MQRRERVLLANVLVVAACALVYELLCGTLASYLLGDAVLQFSLVLGTYLFAMGVGAWASRWLEPQAASRYVQAELLLALVGGTSVPLLLLAVSAHLPLRILLHTVVFVVGALVGLELPLLVRILRDEPRDGAPRNIARAEPPNQVHQRDQVDQHDQSDQVTQPHTAEGGRFGETVARAFAFDYLGALAASLLFPLLLVPKLGLVRTSVACGAVNALTALSATAAVPVRHPQLVRAAGAIVLAILVIAFFRAEAWTASATD